MHYYLRGIMKCWMVYWEDKELDRLIKIPIEVKTFKYKITQPAAWQPIIADEDKTVKKGKIEIIRIKKTYLPKNTMVSPLKILRNEMGLLVTLFKAGKPYLVEEEKEYDKAIFLPFYDGVVKKGDLLGVLKVYFVEINGKKPLIKIPERIERANLVYIADGEILRREVEIKDFKYLQSFVYEYVPIIAASELDVKKGNIYTIAVEEMEIPGNTILDSLYIMRNALVDVLDVKISEGYKKVEEPRKVSKAIFVAVRNGHIEKGDLLGVASLHHIMLKKFAPEPLRREVRAKIVYAYNNKIRREEIYVEPYGHKGTPNGKWEILIADETRKVKSGEFTLIRVKEISLDPKTVVSPLFITRHGIVAVIDVYGIGKPKKIEESQKITHVLILPIFDGVVKRGEMIGVLKVHSVEVKTGEKILDALKKLANALSLNMEDVVDHPDWPFLWR